MPASGAAMGSSCATRTGLRPTIATSSKVRLLSSLGIREERRCVGQHRRLRIATIFAVGKACVEPGAVVEPLWDSATAAEIDGQTTAIVDAGFASGPLDHDRLVVEHAPPPPNDKAAALIG